MTAVLIAIVAAAVAAAAAVIGHPPRLRRLSTEQSYVEQRRRTGTDTTRTAW